MRLYIRMPRIINGFLVLALGALLAQAIACDPGPRATSTDPALDSAASARPLLPSATLTSAKLPTPTVMPRMHTHGPPPFSFAPVPLEQRIYFAPTIVRATLLNGEPTVESVPIGQGVAPIYKAAHIFRFSVVEYLRGDGPSEVTVRHQSNGSFVSESDAWGIAKRSFEGRNASWDDREAVLFLVGQSATGVAGASGQQTQLFQFPDWAWGEFQYTIDTLNKVWLPSAQAPGVSGQSGDRGSRSYLTGYRGDGAGGAAGSGGTSSSISLADLRAQIAAADADLLAGRKGYEECLYRKFAREQDLQAEAITGNVFQPHEVHVSIESNAAWWTEVSRIDYERYEISTGYNRIWLEGADKDFFFAEIEDEDKDFRNGFAEIVATARPLPARVYRASIYGQHALLIPCDYDPRSYNILIVTVTAPEGTIHEAFFDPVAIGSAIGADGANGALEPSAFTANGTSTSLQSLKWHSSGIITLTLSPNASLSGLALDFIALDGSVALTLPASAAKTDAAAGTVTWSSAAAPWRAGDQLMLRIRNAAATTEPTPTATATPTATPTPTPTATATPTPTAAPAPPPGPVSGQ